MNTEVGKEDSKLGGNRIIRRTQQIGKEEEDRKRRLGTGERKDSETEQRREKIRKRRERDCSEFRREWNGKKNGKRWIGKCGKTGRGKDNISKTE